MKQSLKLPNAFVGIAMLLVLWQMLSCALDSPIMPPPFEVLPIFFTLLRGELGLHLLASAGRVVTSILLAVIVAVPAGLALGQMRGVNRIFDPLIAIIYPIPKIVFLPVIYVLFGITDISKIFLISVIIFFQILVVVRDEAANLRPELIQSVRSLGAGRRALFRFVYLPASMPAVLTALRISIGTAIAVLFIAEQSLTTYGLGYYIVVETYQVLLYPEMYAGILGMSLLGLVLYFLIHWLERKVNSHLYLEEQGTMPRSDEPRKVDNVRKMFSRIAGRYDLMNRLMTFGRDKFWRRYVVGKTGLPAGGRLLDVGTGTGDIAFEALRRDPRAQVTGADITIEMMRIGQRRRHGDGIFWCCSDAQQLPFADETFDAATSGYLVRNVDNVRRAFEEQARIVKPGGQIVCLETSPPPHTIFRPLVLLHLKFWVPFLGKRIAGDESAYQYLPETTRAFKTPNELAEIMRNIGLEAVNYRRFMFGTIVVLDARRPSSVNRTASTATDIAKKTNPVAT
ncbi:MAG: ubiquinone/menaquinone biosynthesis methyltransferase [Proteobacteria bacterium]|nr:ubiquinone/menaquinone biosynthesis methyltransferase [Pseudomonadota bacterium]